MACSKWEMGLALAECKGLFVMLMFDVIDDNMISLFAIFTA